MVMANQQTSELPEPCIGSLYDPTTFVAPQFAAIVVSPFLIVVPIRSNQFDATLLPPPAQGIGVISAVGDHSLRFLPRPAFGPGDANFFKRGVRKCNFCRRGTFQPNSQRNTLTVSQYHPLRAFATLGFSDCGAPFLAAAKLPSTKDSSHLSSPLSSSVPSSAPRSCRPSPTSKAKASGTYTWLFHNFLYTSILRLAKRLDMAAVLT